MIPPFGHPPRRRHGVSAIEFAFVAPVVLGFVFGVIELSRFLLLDGNVTSAVLVGVREASLVDSTPSEVDQIIRTELSRNGISDVEIQLSPSVFGPEVEEVQISVNVPINGINGFSVATLVSMNAGISKTIGFSRELGQ